MAGTTYTINQEVTWQGQINGSTVAMTFVVGTLDPTVDQKFVLDTYLVPQGYATNPDGYTGPGTAPYSGSSGTVVDMTGWIYVSDGKGGASFKDPALVGTYGGYFAASVGDGTSTTYTVTHGLNSTDVAVTVRDATVGDIIYPTVTVVDANNISVTFGSAPTANEMRVLVGKY